MALLSPQLKLGLFKDRSVQSCVREEGLWEEFSVPAIEIDRGFIMYLTHFSMDIAIEGFHHFGQFKVVNWVGIPIGCSFNGAAHAVTDAII